MMTGPYIRASSKWRMCRSPGEQLAPSIPQMNPMSVFMSCAIDARET